MAYTFTYTSTVLTDCSGWGSVSCATGHVPALGKLSSYSSSLPFSHRRVLSISGFRKHMTVEGCESQLTWSSLEFTVARGIQIITNTFLGSGSKPQSCRCQGAKTSHWAYRSGSSPTHLLCVLINQSRWTWRLTLKSQGLIWITWHFIDNYLSWEFAWFSSSVLE